MKPFRSLSIILAVAFILILALSGCGSNAGIGAASAQPGEAVQSSQSPSASDSTLKTFTREELKKYNGKNGNPAYVAVDGTVYDVTNVREWRGGDHNGFEAGNDLTEAIKTKSPHGVSKLKGIPIVGKLVN